MHLDHDTVSAPEGVVDVGHGEIDCLNLPRNEGHRFLEAVPELSPKGLAPDQLLVPGKHDGRGRDVFDVAEPAGGLA